MNTCIITNRQFELFYLPVKIQIRNIHGYKTALMLSYK